MIIRKARKSSLPVSWLRRIILFAVLLLFNAAVFFLLWLAFRPGPACCYAVPPSSLQSILEPAVSVAALFFANIAALWILLKIGGPLKADVNVAVTKFRGSLWLTGAAVLAAFLAISIGSLIAIYVLQALKLSRNH